MPYQTRIRVQKNVFKLLKHTLLSIILRVQTNFKYVLILFEGEWSRLLSVSEKCYVDSRLLETVLKLLNSISVATL